MQFLYCLMIYYLNRLGKGGRKKKVTVQALYVGALIRADILCSYRDNAWHEVYNIDKKGSTVYLAVEGCKGSELPSDNVVEIKYNQKYPPNRQTIWRFSSITVWAPQPRRIIYRTYG